MEITRKSASRIKRQSVSEVKWQKAFTGTDRVQISLLKSALDKEGIVNVEFSQQDSSYLLFGKIHLMVPEEDLEAAQALIEQLDLLGDEPIIQ